MVDRGVKHLILLSRSGAVSNAAQELIRKLTRRGVNVAAPRCDISDAHMLGDVLHECNKTMPPIKGVIQATMVLRVCCFLSLSFLIAVLSSPLFSVGLLKAQRTNHSY